MVVASDAAAPGEASLTCLGHALDQQQCHGTGAIVNRLQVVSVNSFRWVLHAATCMWLWKSICGAAEGVASSDNPVGPPAPRASA